MYEVGKNAMGCLEYLLIDLSGIKVVYEVRMNALGVQNIYDRFIQKKHEIRMNAWVKNVQIS